jgi:hypothetical protein
VVVAVIALAVAAVLIVPNVTTQRRARAAVEAYVAALERTLAELDPAVMEPVATMKEQQRVANYVTLLWGQDVLLDSTLLEMDVRSVERSGDDVIVVVEERWRYQQRQSQTGQAVGTATRETQVLQYRLVQGPGRLLVAEVEILSEDQ